MCFNPIKGYCYKKQKVIETWGLDFWEKLENKKSHFGDDIEKMYEKYKKEWEEQGIKTNYFHFFRNFIKRCEFNCGKCEECKKKYAQDWATRIYNEKKYWKKGYFITLSYNNENLPKNRSLNLEDLQKFIKRLRKNIGGYEYVKDKNGKKTNPIRYFACGEYGPRTLRPHYHMCVFNLEINDLEEYKKNKLNQKLYTSKKIEKIWGKGFVIIGEIEYESAGYVAQYCTKKIKKEFNAKHGRNQEFIVMSRNGGLGLTEWIKNKEEIKKNKGFYCMTLKGVKLKPIPRFYKKKWEEENIHEFLKFQEEEIEKIKWDKEKMYEKINQPRSEFIKKKQWIMQQNLAKIKTRNNFI